MSLSPPPSHIKLVDINLAMAWVKKLDWSMEKEESALGRLDERFIAGHKRVAPLSLPFLPNLHNEVVRSWEKSYSARVHAPLVNQLFKREGAG